MWDIFISHASEDKDEIARPLAEALQYAGLKVWYDEFLLKPGDSLSDSIREGQNKSTYALIILSPNFFKNEKWAKHELRGFITREVYEGKTIIPVWHKVTQQDVRRFAPDLADKMAVSTSRGLDYVVQQILSVFPEKEKHFREKKKPTKQAKAAQQTQRTPRAPAIQEPLHLRSEPLVVSEDEARKVFKLNEVWHPLEYIQNDFRTPRAPAIQEPLHLRSEPLVVSEAAAQKRLGVDKNWHPREYIENQFEDQGETVIDHRTGLIWQKSGSNDDMTYEAAQEYVKELNRKRFGGYNGWRLPTIAEFISLLESEKQSNDLYINPIFDATQKWCWSADRHSSESAWGVYFHKGGLVYWGDRHLYVRCVRSRPAP